MECSVSVPSTYLTGRTLHPGRETVELHAKTFGTRLSLCGRDTTNWHKFFDMPFEQAGEFSCITCAYRLGLMVQGKPMPARATMGRRRALVVGEALIDRVVSTSRAPVETPGGSPLNVAVTLGRLGAEVDLLTALGDDDRGHLIRAHLSDSHVSCRGSEQATRTSLATASLQPDGAAAYDFDVSWEFFGGAVSTRPYIVHAGSIALFMEPGATAVHRLLNVHRPTSIISLDPNIRPSLLGSPVTVRRRFDRLTELADIVKLSDEDAAWLYPELDFEGVVERLIRAGVGLVCITRGAHGSMVASRGRLLELPPVEVSVADTIGAGDAFMGALLFQAVLHDYRSWLRAPGAMPVELLHAAGTFAGLVAARTVSRPGADPPWALATMGRRADPGPVA